MLALVNKMIASLRKEPAFDSELVDEDLYGMTVEVLAEPIPRWFFIRTQYQYTGYVHCSELLIDTDMVNYWNKLKKKVVVRSYVDVLSIPKIQGLRLISLTRGSCISVLDEAMGDGWVKVGLCDGNVGYMKEESLNDCIIGWSRQEENSLRRNIVNSAISYMGTQYRWGGRSSLGIDCSGLCLSSYMLNGVIIYRDAKIMEGFPIHEISIGNMKPCDLLYFPGHVALYIGNGAYIHSTGKMGSDGVVINSLDPMKLNFREDLAVQLKAVGSIF